MNFENICSLMDKFDASDSVYLELETEEGSIKLKKAEACKTACVSAQIPAMPFPSAMPFSPAAQGMIPTDAYQANAGQANAGWANEGQANTGQANAGKGMQEPDASLNRPEFEDEDMVKAPLVGVFYAAPSPEKPAFVQVGSRVEKGDTLCLIEAMKMMSEVVAPKSGVIREIFAENGAMVEFDAPLFAIQE